MHGWVATMGMLQRAFIRAETLVTAGRVMRLVILGGCGGRGTHTPGCLGAHDMHGAHIGPHTLAWAPDVHGGPRRCLGARARPRSWPSSTRSRRRSARSRCEHVCETGLTALYWRCSQAEILVLAGTVAAGGTVPPASTRSLLAETCSGAQPTRDCTGVDYHYPGRVGDRGGGSTRCEVALPS